jgi:predicted RNA-binding protein with TRAM domain
MELALIALLGCTSSRPPPRPGNQEPELDAASAPDHEDAVSPDGHGGSAGEPDASNGGGPADAAESGRDAGDGSTSARDAGRDLPGDVLVRADASASSDGGSVGGPSRCQGAGLAVCEDFEATAIGGLPTGWARRGGGYGGKSMAVAADDAARGMHALKIEGGTNGSQFLEYRGTLGPLATAHWGRIFFRVKVPAPWPATGVLHGDLVQHIGPHPGGGLNGVRWGIVENTQMKFQWIFNVQPNQGENEFGDGTSYDYSWPGRWQCLEWHYDQPSQSGAVWLDGAQLPITVGKSHAPEIPVFTSLGVGWANYQNAPGGGFVVWIDEVAFDGARVGCSR